MQFSKWHALGNSYLVVEQPDAGPLDAGTRPAALLGRDGNRLRRRARGRLGATVDRVDVTIWNPDGSTAEMSGNGVRIAAPLARSRDRGEPVTVTTSGREIRSHARRRAGGRARITGTVEIGDPESLDVSGKPSS